MKHRITRLSLCILIILPQLLLSQLASDTLLFTLNLTEYSKKGNLYSCFNPGDISKTLSGPVLMMDNTLLFYSKFGYALYNQSGTCVDYHSLYTENEALSIDDPNRMILAYPWDHKTLIYYTKTKSIQGDYTIYTKKLFKKRVKPVKENEYHFYSNIGTNHLFNFTHNTLTDDMKSVQYLQPRLVGFTSVKSGFKWWSLDKFYSFSSPLIQEKKGTYNSFFPGVKHENYKPYHQNINPVQVFTRDNIWYYTGVYATVGTEKKQYFQHFYIFDSAGNLLYADSLLKQTNHDVVIGQDENTYYTVKKIVQYVFQPAVDQNGNVYYGILDYERKMLEVRKRAYYFYKPIPTEHDLAHLIDVEKSISYEPVVLPCNAKLPTGKTIPSITIITSEGKKIRAKARHLMKQEYIARISRTPYRDVEKKLSRKIKQLPREVQKIQNDLYSMPTVFCPYTVSISGPKGMIRTFKYTPGEKMLSARVLVVHKTNELLVRVDCEKYAELLIVTTDGAFVNRFIFNKQNYRIRRDIIVATEKSPIIELDFEAGGKHERFYRWEKSL